MWSYIKSKKVDYCGVAPLRYNDTTYTDPKDKATILNNYFTSVFISEDGHMPNLDDNPFPNISLIFIHNEDIAGLLSNLEDHKASGPDEIPTTLLKRLATVIRISYSNNDFPSIPSPMFNPYGLEISQHSSDI